MPGLGSSLKCLAAVVAIAAAHGPALAGLPGSTQPGAQQIPPGSLLILRQVPPRNAIISGAGEALAVPMAPPASVFAINIALKPISDGLAASITSTPALGSGGASVSGALDQVTRSNQMIGDNPTERATGSGAGNQVNASVQLGLGALRDSLANLRGAGQ